ncbi:MAG: hypothetical protein IE885_03565 [Campylobacterales bacterium]|nr:hypothetical protein [Campylobacterales bacterium]
MSIKHVSKKIRLTVLMRLLKNNELFDVACSKSGLTLNEAKKLLNKNIANQY